MKSLAIITARGGSKRIPRKNIKEFCSNPIISYPIKSLIESDIFDEIMVSTDDQEIAEIAIKYGAKVPFLRSKKNSDDFATTSDVLLEVIEKYCQIGQEFDNICCIYPTSVFIDAEIIRKSYKKFISSDFSHLASVLRYSHPVQRCMVEEQGQLSFEKPENIFKRTQDLDVRFHDSGQFYFLNISEFVKSKSLFGEENKFSYIELDPKKVVDIDNIEDWELAEIRYKIMKNLFSKDI